MPGPVSYIRKLFNLSLDVPEHREFVMNEKNMSTLYLTEKEKQYTMEMGRKKADFIDTSVPVCDEVDSGGIAVWYVMVRNGNGTYTVWKKHNERLYK